MSFFFVSFFKVVGEDWHEGGGKCSGDEEVEYKVGDEEGGVVGVGGVV